MTTIVTIFIWHSLKVSKYISGSIFTLIIHIHFSSAVTLFTCICFFRKKTHISMPSPFSSKLLNNHQRFGLGQDMFVISLWRALAIGVCVFGVFFIFLSYSPTCQSEIFSPIQNIEISPSSSISTLSEIPTNISHLVFGIVGSTRGWRRRKHYIESWWEPNVTRGYLYLDTPPTQDLLPWPNTSPKYRVSEDNSKLLAVTHHNDTMVRIARGLLETFREGEKGVRWIVMGDDDSIFFTENMVDVLNKYNHNKYVYIGGHSESALPNMIHSYDMGFGGAGVIFSYPLAEALVPKLDDCIKRYPMVIAADQMWQSCLADMGVYLTPEKGIHQIDLHGDISGLLSAHPQAPLISLHHPEKVEPYFPKMDRYKSVSHLMKASKFDQSRLLQQTICYHRGNHWSVSVSWGYSAHIYENIYSRSILQKPLETFRPWVMNRNVRPPLFVFNTRSARRRDSCETPHIFYFESVRSVSKDHVLTTYNRVAPRELATCAFSGNHSAESVLRIRVFTSTTKLTEENRRECCDVIGIDEKNTAEVKYRDCLKDEVIG